MSTANSFVVTGGAGGIGLTVATRLAERGRVVVIDTAAHLDSDHNGIDLVTGDAGDVEVCRRAADLAEEHAPLTGWVNNAAVFRDAGVRDTNALELGALIFANLMLTVVGSHTAVTHFLRCRRPGAIVNVSSHQAQRPVRGALPYATAKSAIEGLTRALAVDHGPDDIRTNAVALGSIATSRYEQFRRDHQEADAQMAALHPLGRVGTATEVADTVAFLLSDAAGFINGAILPVDGGRSVLGPDPESS